MFKQVFRLTVITYIWKRYKKIIVSTLALFAFFWLVGQLHQDYLSYGELNNDKQYIGLSFVIKWLAFIAGFIVYLFFNKQKKDDAKVIQHLETTMVKSVPPETDSPSEQVQNSDPFEQIRQKDKLRSKADFIIEKK